MKEKNKQQLDEALRRLPEYEAPMDLWSHLDGALETDRYLQQNLPHLPEYTPPADVWNQMESTLDAERPVAQTRQLLSWRRLLIAAASVSLLLMAWWGVQELGWSNRTVQASVRYSEEVVDATLLLSATEPEDEAFQLVEDLCKERLPVCEEPAFRQMKAELEELTAAKTALHEAMGRFSTDTDLHAELARIERERSDLLRTMMTMI